jgi:hypothetical protein
VEGPCSKVTVSELGYSVRGCELLEADTGEVKKFFF